MKPFSFLEIEKRLTETKTELGRARSHSANLRNQLSFVSSQLDTEKSQHGKTRKELGELKSIHQTLLSEAKRENQKLLAKVTEYGVANETLKQKLQQEQHEKTNLESKVRDLETVLENKNNEAVNLRDREREIYMKVVIDKHKEDGPGDKITPRKLSLEETKRYFRREILRRRAYSEKTSFEESVDKEPLDKFDEIIQDEGMHDKKTLEIIHSEREAMLKCFEEKLEEINNELNLVKSEKDLANVECTQLKKKLFALEEEGTSVQDRATSPMTKSGTGKHCMQITLEFIKLIYVF